MGFSQGSSFSRNGYSYYSKSVLKRNGFKILRDTKGHLN